MTNDRTLPTYEQLLDAYRENITVRDWYAGMAMMGLLSKGAWAVEELSELIFEFADGALQARKKDVPPASN